MMAFVRLLPFRKQQLYDTAYTMGNGSDFALLFFIRHSIETIDSDNLPHGIPFLANVRSPITDIDRSVLPLCEEKLKAALTNHY